MCACFMETRTHEHMHIGNGVGMEVKPISPNVCMCVQYTNACGFVYAGMKEKNFEELPISYFRTLFEMVALRIGYINECVCEQLK